MAKSTYTVVGGDSLWIIAQDVVGDPLVWKQIALDNNISGPNYKIYPGQKLTIRSLSEYKDEEVTTTTKTETLNSRPSIQFFGLQAGTTRDMFVAWTWKQSYTKHFRVMWYYYANGIWFVGSDSNTKDATDDYKRATWTAPANASKVKVKVLPEAETNEATRAEYWVAKWSTAKEYDFSDNPPIAPSVPSAPTIDGYKLTVEMDNINKNTLNATHIQFRIVKDNASSIYNTSPKIPIATASGTSLGYVSYSCNVDAGSVYKVSCRSYRDGSYSDWTEYSSNIGTMPSASAGISVHKAMTETSVYLEWAAVKNAVSYDIEYTTETRYFDGSNETSTISNIEFTHYEITGLAPGDEYFFRVRAVNENGESAWTPVVSVIVGTTAAAPTTWSSTTTAITGEAVVLYWVHNCEDNSKQTYAELVLTIDGETTTELIKTEVDDEEEEEKTHSWTIDTSKYKEGTVISWKVRTAGITKAFGEYSTQRQIDVYAPPTLAFSVIDANGNILNTIESFPFFAKGIAGPETQTPVSYHLTITSNEVYESVDSIGNVKMVNVGEEVYSKYFDINSSLMVEFSAGNIDLENNVSYTVSCTVTMSSGLNATASSVVNVAWTDELYEPNAEIGFNEDTISTYIRPYCEDEDDNTIEGVTLSVYRREFDGSFVEIAKDLDNTKNTFVVDPHPALDFARYRIVAKTVDTGAISYYDVPGYPIQEKAAILQWGEDWSGFEVSQDEPEQPTWSGSMLKLPYNVDVSDKNSPEVSLIEYVGRKRPVSYYGTHLGEKSTWSVEIAKNDVETLYALRRLAIWMGDVYVREPSGSGYWANVSVSFSQTHCEVTIPVTLDIVRVEGGI